MPAFHIQSSVEIDAPRLKIHTALVDFNTWPIWSPWLYVEPDAKLTYQGIPGEVDHGYYWLGNKTGEGKMVMRSITDTRIESDLTFLKPFKSHADVAFDLEAVSEKKTLVTWHMNSSLPFFMFFMVGTTKGMIKGDYKRGLTMLKDYIETGNVPTKCRIDGVVDMPSADYVGTQASTTMEGMSDSMSTVMLANQQVAVDANAEINGLPFSIYNNMDIKTGACTFTAAIPVSKAPTALNGAASFATRAACKALKVVHTGPYRHLGNGWSMAMGEMRHAKLKADKQTPPFEIYQNDSQSTPEAELVTEIYVPVRG